MGDCHSRRWVRLLGIASAGVGLGYDLFQVLYYAGIGGDASQDYDAAVNILSGISPYSIPNSHPPLAALLFVPLTCLDHSTAFIVFGLLSLLLVHGAVQCVCDDLAVPATARWYVAAAFAFWPALTSSLALGALSSLVSALVLLGWCFLRRQHHISGGFMIGVAALLKIYPGLLVLYLLLCRRYMAFFSSVLTVALGFGLSLVVIGWPAHIQGFADRMPYYSSKFLDFFSNTSLPGTIERFFGSSAGWVLPVVECPMAASVCSVVMGLLFISLTVRRSTSGPSKFSEIDVLYSLYCVTMLIVSPVSWLHYYQILALPLLILLRNVLCSDKSEGLLFLSFVVFMLSGVGSLVSPPFPTHPPFSEAYRPALSTIGALFPTIGAVCLWVKFYYLSDRGEC